MACTYRIHCSASDELSLAIVNGDVVLAKSDPRDDRQDEAGSPAFALVNKSTGEALKHSFGCNVRAIKFDPGYRDESILWADSHENLGGGFRRVHMINNMDYIFDAERATPRHGGARHGTRLGYLQGNTLDQILVTASEGGGEKLHVEGMFSFGDSDYGHLRQAWVEV
ncbi:hypothetical protein ACP70R_014079 [Stipagrostis hirtigluma subsp. patula]